MYKHKDTLAKCFSAENTGMIPTSYLYNRMHCKVVFIFETAKLARRLLTGPRKWYLNIAHLEYKENNILFKQKIPPPKKTNVF